MLDEGTLWSYETFLPIQATAQANARALGERRLVADLLVSALHDYFLPGGKEQREAKLWLLEGSLGYVTAREACSYLGVDYGCMRQELLSGKRFRLAEFRWSRQVERYRELPIRLCTYRPHHKPTQLDLPL